MNEHRRQPSNVPAPHEGYEPVPPQYHYPDYAYYGGVESEGPDWRYTLALLWQRKIWILAALVLGVAGGFLFSQTTEPLYRAYTTVWVEDTDGENSSSAVRPDEVLQGAGWASIFESYAVLVPVAEELGLYVESLEPKVLPEGMFDRLELSDDLSSGVYEYRTRSDGAWTLERVGSGLVQRGSSGEVVGEEAGFAWTPPPEAREPETRIRFRITSPRDAAIRVWDGLDVDYNEYSSLITARLTWNDPEEAAEILNALSAKFIDVATDLKSRKMREEREILEEQTQYVGDALDDAELALERYRVNTITLPSENNAPVATGTGAQDPVFGTYFERRLDASQLENDIQQIEQMLAELRAGGNPNPIALRMIPSLGEASQVSAALEELHTKEVERRTLLYTYTEEWPQVQKLTQEIQALRQRTIPALLNEAASQLREQLAVVQGHIEAQASQLREIPSRSIETTRRRREANLHADLYNSLKVRLNNARLAQATAELADMQVVDEAVPPREPSQNEAPRIVLLASLGALGLGIAGVLLHDRLDRKIRHPQQVTKTLGLPVLGVVPELNGRKKVSGPSAAMAIEAFRGIRTQLSRAGGAEGTLTMVTSPAPREGKSTVAANLAISYASAGYRTALVDGDTRRGRAHEMFGLDRAPGLSDYLMDRAELEKICQETGVDNLDLIGRGSTRDFSADRLDSEAVDRLLTSLRERYDAVVIDAPPLAAGADALLLGERADKCILVVRSGSTNEDLARTKLEMVGNVELHMVGTVLNAVPENAPYYSHYVNYYYADTEIG